MTRCTSHRPLEGADSEQECPLCHGSGVVMGGDEYHSCPKCEGTGAA